MSIKLEFLKNTDLENFIVQHKISDNSEISYAHFHQEYEVFLLKHGELETTINGRTYSVTDNTMILANSVDIHQNVLKKRQVYERYVVMFKPEYATSLSAGNENLLDCFLFPNTADGAKIAKLSDEDFEDLVESFKKLEECSKLSEDEYGTSLKKKFAFGDFLVEVNKKYRKAKNISPKENEKTVKLVYGIIRFLQKNYNKSFILDDISRELDYDKNYMCSVFKHYTGVPIMTYLLRFRIQEAKNRLKNGCSVEETCEFVGFNSLAHFSRTFKSYVGVSPKQFQKANK